MRIARCRVVRRDVSTVVKVPRHQVVLVDPEGLLGVLMARIIVKMSSSNANGSDPYMVKEKSSLVQSMFSPRDKFVVNSDDSAHAFEQDCSFLNVGSSTDAEDGRRRNPHLQMRYMAPGGAGECQPELPEDGLLVAPISHIGDLQAEISSLPVENRNGNYFDTNYTNMAQEDRIEITGHKRKEISNLQNTRDATQRIPFKQKKKIQALGYVPIQIANLSLEEIELGKYGYVGVASPTQITDTYDCIGNVVNSIEQTHKGMRDEFKDYLREKLVHLDAKDRCILEPVLQRYKHLFYGLGSTELGCSSQVEHSIETGDARPIKRTPYRTPYALKPVVEEHIDDMLKRNIIEPNMSPWSSSILLVQKKSKNGSIKYTFCIDY